MKKKVWKKEFIRQFIKYKKKIKMIKQIKKVILFIINIKEIGIMIKKMGLESWYIKTVRNMKEYGKIIKKMDKELYGYIQKKKK